jgi:hypothetical protein
MIVPGNNPHLDRIAPDKRSVRTSTHVMLKAPGVAAIVFRFRRALNSAENRPNWRLRAQQADQQDHLSAASTGTEFLVWTPSGILQEEALIMRQRYQQGCIRCTKREAGPARWEYLWRENDVTGKRVRRTTVIGTVEQYPTRDLAQAAVNGLRMQINEDRLRHPWPDILVADLVDHYVQTELSKEIGWHSHATRIVYRQFLTRWIRPHWGKVSVCSVRTIAVEHWLRGLQRVDGTPLANTTKAKIRNLLSVLFNHAIRYEWLGQGGNPITLVRQSAKRMRTPEVLEPSEIQSLLLQLKSCFRLMVLLDVTTGLRRSELFALKWSDVDFSNLRLDVLRSIYLQHVGDFRRFYREEEGPEICCPANWYAIGYTKAPKPHSCNSRPAGKGVGNADV